MIEAGLLALRLAAMIVSSRIAGAGVDENQSKADLYNVLLLALRNRVCKAPSRGPHMVISC